MVNPAYNCDGYKLDHKSQYPDGTGGVYSNFTARKSRVKDVNHIVAFGTQYVIQRYLQEDFQENFFNKPLDEVIDDYAYEIGLYLGSTPKTDHIADLHRLGYLPVSVKAIPEGMTVPLQVPLFTVENTIDRFFWVTNFLETIISSELWMPCTSATTAQLFRQNFLKYAELTGVDKNFVAYQGHDFSFRGMAGRDAAMASGAAHLLSFIGTDTIPAIKWLRKYYDTPTGMIGMSVPATEHSTQCASAGADENIEENEFRQFDRLISEIYPHGIVSIVSDSYDFWGVVTRFLPRLKDKILARNGKVVIRPDTGTPHLVICGNPDAEDEAERKGLVRCLYETFGGFVNHKGFIDLNPKIGAIYGDSIDMMEQELILNGLYRQGFSSGNIVLGIGSFTYQYVTRDTYGLVCKATNCTVNGQDRPIFKAPKTGAWKKSHKGLLHVSEDFTVSENVSREMAETGLLLPVFKDGKFLKRYTLNDLRGRLMVC